MMTVHRVELAVLFVFCAIGSVGCQRDHGFQTHAVYRAPLNRFELTVDVSGVVLAGHDVSDNATGCVRVTSLDDAAPVSVELELDGSVNMVSLQQILSTAGLEVASRDELRECVQVINGALGGPKGTTLKGQSESLEVIEVTAKYERQP